MSGGMLSRDVEYIMNSAKTHGLEEEARKLIAENEHHEASCRVVRMWESFLSRYIMEGQRERANNIKSTPRRSLLPAGRWLS
jgi:hypothetical protein